MRKSKLKMVSGEVEPPKPPMTFDDLPVHSFFKWDAQPGGYSGSTSEELVYKHKQGGYIELGRRHQAKTAQGYYQVTQYDVEITKKEVVQLWTT